jgi:hypothetical protein
MDTLPRGSARSEQEMHSQISSSIFQERRLCNGGRIGKAFIVVTQLTDWQWRW